MKLNRDVVIKFLPDMVAHDVDRVARFTREAQALAVEMHENWIEATRYLNMEELKKHKKQQLREVA